MAKIRLRFDIETEPPSPSRERVWTALVVKFVASLAAGFVLALLL